jgi:hypothetical protein
MLVLINMTIPSAINNKTHPSKTWLAIFDTGMKSEREKKTGKTEKTVNACGLTSSGNR